MKELMMTGASQNLSASPSDGRKVYVLLPGNGAYKVHSGSLVMIVH